MLIQVTYNSRGLEGSKTEITLLIKETERMIIGLLNDYILLLHLVNY